MHKGELYGSASWPMILEHETRGVADQTTELLIGRQATLPSETALLSLKFEKRLCKSWWNWKRDV